MDKLTIADVMTKNPLTLSGRQSIDSAQETMKEHGIHHVPVTEGRKVLGVVTDRELESISAMFGSFTQRASLNLRDLCREDPYIVSPDSSLGVVVRSMADKHLTSAIVVNSGGDIEGIFTTTDALRLVSQKYVD